MKKKKILIFSTLVLFTFGLFTPNVLAASKYYLSVGTDYGSIGGNSVPEASWVGGTLTLNQYIGSTVTAPTYSSFNSQYLGRYTLESDVLYFLGHAATDHIAWNYLAKNGNYAVGIKNTASDSNMGIYKMTGIGRYNMSKVKLAIFQGCSTASDPNSNLPKYANSRGANVAIGWASNIQQSDSLPWIKRFFSNGFFPNNVTNMVNYANSFGYVTSDIKNTRVYGNGGSSVFPSSVNAITKSASIDNRRHSINEPYNVNLYSIQDVKSKIVELIKNNINNNVNENDFIIEMAENNGGKIYDLYFTINGIKTNLVYTAFTNESGTVITDIYDNMNNYEISTLKNERTQFIKQKLANTNNKNLNEISTNALKKVQEANKNTEANIITVFNYYNVEDEKLYQITQVKVETDTGAYSIIDYKTEL